MKGGIQKTTATTDEAPPKWTITVVVKSYIDHLEEWVFDDCRDCEMDDAATHARKEYQADEKIPIKCKTLRYANIVARQPALVTSDCPDPPVCRT
jgi:hypothetical protein